MFQLPPQILLGCSNSKWYLNLVFHPLNTSCKNQGPTRHEHNVTAFYTTAKKKRPNQLGYLVGIWL